MPAGEIKRMEDEQERAGSWLHDVKPDREWKERLGRTARPRFIVFSKRGIQKQPASARGNHKLLQSFYPVHRSRQSYKGPNSPSISRIIHGGHRRQCSNNFSHRSPPRSHPASTILPPAKQTKKSLAKNTPRTVDDVDDEQGITAVASIRSQASNLRCTHRRPRTLLPVRGAPDSGTSTQKTHAHRLCALASPSQRIGEPPSCKLCSCPSVHRGFSPLRGNP